MVMVAILTFVPVADATVTPALRTSCQAKGAPANTLSCATGANIVVGDGGLICATWYATGNVPTVTLSAGTATVGTISQITTVTQSSSTQTFEIGCWKVRVTGTGSATFQLDFGTTKTQAWIDVEDWNGATNLERITAKTGSGTYTSGTTVTASVASFTPTSLDLSWSYGSAQTCAASSAPSAVSPDSVGAAYVSGNDFATGTNCQGTLKFNMNQYSATYTGSSATTMGIKANWGSSVTTNTGGWAIIAVEIEPQVTQPFTYNVQSGAASTTVTLSSTSTNCFLSGTSISTGSTSNVNLDPSCGVTEKLPDPTGTTRYRFNDGSNNAAQKLVNGTSCSATGANCANHIRKVFYQLANTYKISSNPSPAKFGANLDNVSMTGTWVGISSSTLCGTGAANSTQATALKPASATTTDGCKTQTGVAVFADYNTGVSFSPNPMTGTGVPTNGRWFESSSTCNLAQTTAGNTPTCPFYLQWSTTIQITAKAQTTFDGSLSATLSVTQLGSAAAPVITTTAGHATDSTTIYIDNASSVIYPATLGSAPTSTRWCNGATATTTQTCATSTLPGGNGVLSGGQTLNQDYYKQLSTTFNLEEANKVSTVWQPPQSDTLTMDVSGSCGTALAGANCNITLTATAMANELLIVQYATLKATACGAPKVVSPTTTMTLRTDYDPSSADQLCIYYGTISSSAQTPTITCRLSAPAGTYASCVAFTVMNANTSSPFDGSVCQATVSASTSISCTKTNSYYSDALIGYLLCDDNNANVGCTVTNGLSMATINLIYTGTTCSTRVCMGARAAEVLSTDVGGYAVSFSSLHSGSVYLLVGDAIRAAYDPNVKSTYLGSSNIAVCGIPTGLVFSQVSTCTAYIDYNSSPSLATTTISANERWSASTPTPLPVTAPASDVAFYYYNQIRGTLHIVPTAPSLWDASRNIKITSDLLGTKQVVHTFTPSNGGGATSAQFFIDYNNLLDCETSTGGTAGTAWVANTTEIGPLTTPNWNKFCGFTRLTNSSSTTATTTITTATTHTSTINTGGEPPNLLWLLLIPVGIVVFWVLRKKLG